MSSASPSEPSFPELDPCSEREPPSENTLLSRFVGRGAPDDAVNAARLREVLSLGLRFKARDAFMIPSGGKSPTEIANEPLPIEGTPFERLLEELERDYLPGMPNFGSRSFIGFPDSGNSVAGLSGAVLADFLNVNMINSTFCSRIATDMEIAVIRWLRTIVGYPHPGAAPSSALDVGGMALAGGTMSNYTALLLARERAFPGTLRTGVTFDPRKVRVVIPQGIAHYTVAAAMAWGGLGSDNVLRAPIRDFKYDLDALRGVLRAAKERGEKVVMGVAYAGDSRSMTIDRLPEVARVFRAEFPEIWMHCDGCHGTSLLFSKKERGRLDGIADYDSITLDPHKVLTVPYPTSFLLLREPSHGRTIQTQSDLIMRQERSLGQTTPVLGSKAFHSLRLWMLLRGHGVRGIGRMIEFRLAQARRFVEVLREYPEFVRLNDVNINSVVFSVVPRRFRGSLDEARVEIVSKLTRRVYERILADGRMYIHSFVIADSSNRLGAGAEREVDVLRYMAGNPLIDEADMRRCLDWIREFAIEEESRLLSQGDAE